MQDLQVKAIQIQRSFPRPLASELQEVLMPLSRSRGPMTGFGVLLGSILLGGFSSMLIDSAFAETAKGKTSASEEVYKALFGKKRASESDQKRARTNTAIMGIRGLDDDQDSSLKAKAAANIRAVYEMEDRTADAAMVEILKEQIKGALPSNGVSNLPRPIDNNKVAPEDLELEIDLGRKMAAQILGANKPYESERVSLYLNSLTKVLADSGLTAERPFRVSILNSEKINAFACPGGYIFVTKGALKNTQTESQLAALLGHEIVHVSKRHLLSSLQKKINGREDSNKKSEKITDPHTLARQRIRPEQSTEKNSFAQLLGPKGVGLTLLQASSEALETLLSKGLEKDFEFEADRLGQQVSSAAGYESKSLVNFLTRLKTQNTNVTNTTSNTHPPFDARIENISRFVETLVGQASATASSSSLFRQMQQEWSR